MPDEAVELAYSRRPYLEPPSSKLDAFLSDRASIHYEPTLSGAGYRRVIDLTGEPPAKTARSMGGSSSKAYEKDLKRARKEEEERGKREKTEREKREKREAEERKRWEKEMREWEKEEARREKMKERERREEDDRKKAEKRREEMLKSMESRKGSSYYPPHTPKQPSSFFASKPPPKPSALKPSSKPSPWLTSRTIDSQTQERVYPGMSRAAAYAIMSLEEVDAKARGVSGWK